jgi:hypothetical protein
MRENAPPATQIIGTLLVALSMAACNQAPSPFEGAWTVTDGGVTLACDGGTLTEPVAGSIVIIDYSGGLFAWIDGIAEGFKPSGDSATRTANGFLLLTFDGGSGASLALTLDSDTLFVDGGTLLEQASGMELNYASGGVPAACAFTRWINAVHDSP